MKYNIISFLSFILLCTFLTSCNHSTKAFLGLNKQGPDEYKVRTGSTLTIPPNFDLRPPASQQNATHVDSSRVADGTKALLKGESQGVPVVPVRESALLSSAETRLLEKARTQNTDSSVRAALTQQRVKATEEEKSTKRSFLDKLWPFSSEEKKGTPPTKTPSEAKEKPQINQEEKPTANVEKTQHVIETGKKKMVIELPSFLQKLLN